MNAAYNIEVTKRNLRRAHQIRNELIQRKHALLLARKKTPLLVSNGYTRLRLCDARTKPHCCYAAKRFLETRIRSGSDQRPRFGACMRREPSATRGRPYVLGGSPHHGRVGSVELSPPRRVCIVVDQGDRRRARKRRRIDGWNDPALHHVGSGIWRLAARSSFDCRDSDGWRHATGPFFTESGDGSRIRARMKPEERLSSQRVKARRHKGHFGACEQSL